MYVKPLRRGRPPDPSAEEAVVRRPGETRFEWRQPSVREVKDEQNSAMKVPLDVYFYIR